MAKKKRKKKKRTRPGKVSSQPTERVNRRWQRPLLAAGLCLAAVVTGTIMTSQTSTEQNNVAPARFASSQAPQGYQFDFPLDVPEVDIELESVSPARDPLYNTFNSVIGTAQMQIWEKTAGEKGQAELTNLLKQELESRGIDVTVNKTTPQDIFDAIHDYYVQNGYWSTIVTLQWAGTQTGRGKQLFGSPIKEQYRISFNYNGKTRSYPVYVIEDAESFTNGIGTATKRGIVISDKKIRELVDADGYERRKLISDVAFHEASHKVDADEGRVELHDEYDWDAAKVIDKAVGRSETRAFLKQAAHGQYPCLALKAPFLIPIDAYAGARSFMRDSLQRLTAKNRRYFGSRLDTISSKYPTVCRQAAYASLQVFESQRR